MLNNTISLKSEKGLTSNTLKVIAIIAMTIDHTAGILFPNYSLDNPLLFMRVIGRLTAPIMMFLIVEGYTHTRNIKKYVFRLFILAIISHFAFVFAFDKDYSTIFEQTSVIWSFLMGLIALAISENIKLKMWQKVIIIGLCMVAAFPANWSTPAALSILFMGRNRDSFRKKMICLVVCIAMYSIVYFIFINKVYALIQMLIVLAIPILYQYNGQRGNWKEMKWFFYIYYPLHLIILGLIRLFILHKV